MAEKIGIIGRKLGMTRIFNDDGAAVPVTVLQVGPCPVTQVKTTETDGYNALQIAYVEAKEKHVSKAMQGHFAKAGTGLFRTLKEVRLNDTPEQKAGDTLTVDLFSVGEVVKVTGKSIGKGYQGRMRRWNFRGCKDTHGDERCTATTVPLATTPSPATLSRAARWQAIGVTRL